MGLKCQFKETDDDDGDEATREVKGGERECVMTVSFLKSAASCSNAAARDCLASTHPATADGEDGDVASFVTAIISPLLLPSLSHIKGRNRVISAMRGPPSLNDGAGRVIHSREVQGVGHGTAALNRYALADAGPFCKEFAMIDGANVTRAKDLHSLVYTRSLPSSSSSWKRASVTARAKQCSLLNRFDRSPRLQ